MGSVTIQLDDKVHEKLKRMAKFNLRSLRNEIAVIVRDAVYNTDIEKKQESLNDVKTEVAGMQVNEMFMD